MLVVQSKMACGVGKYPGENFISLSICPVTPPPLSRVFERPYVSNGTGAIVTAAFKRLGRHFPQCGSERPTEDSKTSEKIYLK